MPLSLTLLVERRTIQGRVEDRLEVCAVAPPICGWERLINACIREGTGLCRAIAAGMTQSTCSLSFWISWTHRGVI